MSRSFGYRQFAEDVVALLDQLGIERIAIVGWSDGAITGLELAMAKPERVSKLFAFGANKTVEGLKPTGSRSGTFAMFVECCKAEYPRLSPHRDRWPQLVDGRRAMWRSQPSFTTQRLATIKAPTTIADSEYYEIIKLEQTEEMSREAAGPYHSFFSSSPGALEELARHQLVLKFLLIHRWRRCLSAGADGPQRASGLILDHHLPRLTALKESY